MRGSWFFVAVTTVCIVSAGLAIVDFASNGAAIYVPHAPIQINGNDEFTLANGVTGGTGTELDPYVIEGHEIDAADGTGISVSNTDAHFVIRSCFVHSGTSGIYLTGVSNGSVSSCMTDNYDESIVLAYSDNSTVVGNTVTAVTWGVEVIDSKNCLVQWNNATGLNDGASIVVWASESIVVRENNITGFGSHGIWVSSSSNCTFVDNRAGPYGCFVEASVGCSFWNNSFTSSGICLLGSTVAHVNSHDIPENNTADDLPIKYLSGLTGGTYAIGNVGQVIIAGCSDIMVTNGSVYGLEYALEPAWYAAGIECVLSDNVTIWNWTLGDCGNAIGISASTSIYVTKCLISDSWTGVYFENSEHLFVDNCTISWTDEWTDEYRGEGVRFYQSNYSLVTDCSIFDAGFSGVSISNSHDASVLRTIVTNTTQTCIYAGGYRTLPYNLTFRNCTLTRATWSAFELRDVSDALIDGNMMTDFLRAVELYDSTNVTISNNSVMTSTWDGVSLYAVSNCTISDNLIAGNGYGITAGFDSSNLTIACNSIAMNNVGLSCSSLNMTVYHNDFYSNNMNVYSYRAGDIWNLTYPGGGNYWDDYTGEDVFSGPAQDLPGSDGLGDTPFAIRDFLGDFDNYPLMEPFLGPLKTGPTAQVTISPAQGDTMTEFIFDASNSSDPQDATILLEVRWDFDSNGIWDTGWTTDKVISHYFESSGMHYVTVQVRDSDGFTDTAHVQVLVVDVIPEFGDFSIITVLVIMLFVTALERKRRHRRTPS